MPIALKSSEHASRRRHDTAAAAAAEKFSRYSTRAFGVRPPASRQRHVRARYVVAGAVVYIVR